MVTGSHIASPNLQSTSPIIEATANDIKIQGVTKIEDLLNQMPQVFAGQNATVSNGATGTSEVDLRGLGCDRTLVLVDGRRLPYGSPLDSCADLNQVPTILVDRVEVLTGGASAVYGSDAVSGVVNFIMKKDFEGVQVDVQYGTFQHDNDYDGPGNVRSVIAAKAATNPTQFALPPDSVWDGGGKQISALLGVNSDNGKGNLTAFFTWRQDSQITEANRDYSACTFGAPVGASYTCGGSGTSYPGEFIADSGVYTVDKTTGNTFRPYSSATDAYNYGPLNYYERPDERYSAGVMGHYELSPHADAYTQISYSDYHTVSQIAPGGDFGNTASVNCGNPLLSGQEATTLGCSPADIAANNPADLYVLRRNVEGGGRQEDIRDTSFRAVAGVKGEIDDVWSYDLTASYSLVNYTQSSLNEFSSARLQNALNVVDVGGVPTCESVVNGSDPSCVPYNVFSIGGVTPAALNYLQIPALRFGSTLQQSLTAQFNGDLGHYGLQSPWAKDGIQVAFGAEYRIDRLSFITDLENQTGDIAGSGGAAIGISGATHVAEGYGEASIPLVQDAFLAQSISLELAMRYSSYDSIDATTYKIGADWAPTDDIRFRGSFDRAVRAPNVIDLFLGQGFNLFDQGSDPCGPTPNGHGGFNAPTASLAACQRTPGAGSAPWYNTALLNSPANQYNFQQGGNLNLGAEKADTFTVGFVATPTFLPGFTASIDYFDIKLRNAISALDPTAIEDSCYTDNVAASCALIHRNPGNGSLWIGSGFVDSRNTNIGGVRTSGIDFSAAYALDLTDVGWDKVGSLSFSLNGTYLNTLTTDTGLGGSSAIYSCVARFSSNCGTPNPAWRHIFRVGWTTPWDDIVLTGTWRFFGGVKEFGVADLSVLGTRLGAQNYFDLQVAAPVMTGATIRLGVNNLFDTDPPLTNAIGTTGNGNTFPQSYDSFGRYLFADLTVDL
ncbi:MAG: TonB-dependent receptor [Rhizomicrobium sp.]